MNGRVVVVTGGFGALGRVVAGRALKAGAFVAVLDHAATAPEGFETESNGRLLKLPGSDLSSEEGARVAVAEVARHYGRLDVLVNIAGGFCWQTVEAGDPAAWETLFRLNVLTALCTSRAALPLLRVSDAGRIVNVGAAAALRSAAGMGAYTASKSGVHRLTESLAEELKPARVTVNAVLPTTIDTPSNRAEMPTADFSAWVSPDELANVILFLASREASAVTGALIPVNGRT